MQYVSHLFPIKIDIEIYSKLVHNICNKIRIELLLNLFTTLLLEIYQEYEYYPFERDLPANNIYVASKLDGRAECERYFYEN